MDHSFRISIAPASGQGLQLDLMQEDQLRVFDLDKTQLSNIRMNFDVPGYFYEEFGEATNNHPCAGSACMVFDDQYGRLCSIDVIGYYDYNLKRNHAGGKPHFNTEIRYMRNGVQINRCNKFEGHIIEDSSEIIIETVFDGCTNKKTVKREPKNFQ
jgi:hypothetical protein